MKLTKTQVSRMKRDLANGTSQTDCAAKYGVSIPMVNHIASGKAHAEVEAAAPRKTVGQLSPEKVALIKALLAQGLQQTMIAEKFGVTPAMVTFIKQGRSHASVEAADTKSLVTYCLSA
jgi:predicted transcriptional regulator